MASVLVVDSDADVASELSQELRREGHKVRTASDAPSGLKSLREYAPDLVILDPVVDEAAFEVCRRMRRETTAPIIILTERSDELDKVVGLELGADDYVTKPFSKKELLARVRVQLRRSERSLLPSTANVTAGDFHADLLTREFLSGNKLIALPPKEFELLAFLMHNAGRTFTREQLLRQIWSYEAVGRTRTVDVHINRLRAKIERDSSHPRWLITVRGLGYRFRS